MNRAEPLSGCSLTIELSPEFGWPGNNGRVYGPGTVFQGHIHVCIRRPVRAHRLRLVFQGTEAMQPYDVGPGVVRARQAQLFGIQHVLWENNTPVCEPSNQSFPFTIQMPLVQYPPTIDHELYRCTFKLSAYLDPSLEHKAIPIMMQRPVAYIPLIETRLLKTPHNACVKKGRMAVTAMIQSLEYTPGETIQTVLHIASKVPVSGISIKLYQVARLLLDERPTITKMVAEKSYKAPSLSLDDTYNGYHTLQLSLPLGLAPSFDYSRIIDMSYKLRIKISKKSLVPWMSRITFDYPITIGTLAHGIRNGSDLQLYTAMQDVGDGASIISNHSDSDLPLPRFLRLIEYEDALPLYESTRLPSYETTNCLT
ncbi:hypothetical protein DFQ28_009562 [Apophysomyces sp. BC1034]|nr:hypothetical protein DFQ30_009345 [Apophysomyces sp. BC1015]KAG0175847.1 hypothetical protein DFQ29_006954 [Apophysomyces sp. BC1021]KAG0185311.1 hypothetical protein DFQ28_009562 [Apophysomyces sp. BC1034]